MLKYFFQFVIDDADIIQVITECFDHPYMVKRYEMLLVNTHVGVDQGSRTTLCKVFPSKKYQASSIHGRVTVDSAPFYGGSGIEFLQSG